MGDSAMVIQSYSLRRPRNRRGLQRLTLAVLLAVCSAALTACLAGTFGVVGVKAIDGDSIEVRFPSGLLVEVRLLSIDCPERGQPLSEEAAEFTQRWVEGRTLTLQTGAEERDHYNRLLAVVETETANLNIDLVRNGLCVVTIIPPNIQITDELLAAQEQAHEQKIGIWSAEGPSEEPRSYRARNFRDKKQAPVPLSYDNHVVIGNRRSRTAHWPGCRHVEEMASHNRVYFSSVAEAKAQGYRMEKGSR